MVTDQTKLDAFKKVSVGERQRLVIEAINVLNEATANEIAHYLKKEGHIPYFNRNFVHPRINELVQMDILQVCGKKFDRISERVCAVYRRKNDTYNQ